MSRTICNYDVCTGCAACQDICPKQCITMKPDSMDALHPQIDENVCIDCGLCEKTCPNNIDLAFKTPQKVWAAWSNDEEVRRTSASGGIAYELYRHWLRNGGVAAGVVYNRNEGCLFTLIEKESDIASTQNSKYTFSNTSGIYKVIKAKLKDGVRVLFIGVPCQVAGLYGFLRKGYDNLTTVDIICHGMPPATYLEQHISEIERQKKEYTSELFFRDPKYYTYSFTFTLKNKDSKEFYRKQVLTCDNYQLGYHHALIYRENCYSCRYAQQERIADLTIGDFSGLGRLAPFGYVKNNVSCILQNTNKGAILLDILKNNAFTLIERPAEEAFNYEKQLKSPSVRHKKRFVFEGEYRRTHNFKTASDKALVSEKIEVRKAVVINKFRHFVHSILVVLHIKK